MYFMENTEKSEIMSIAASALFVNFFPIHITVRSQGEHYSRLLSFITHAHIVIAFK